MADLIPWPPPYPGAPIVGTPVWVSPEEFQEQASPASDQYRLAFIYFWMRTGRHPFAGSSLFERLVQQFQGEPDLGAVPEAERKVLRRALAREPGQRHAGCAELMWELKWAVPGRCAPPRAGLPRLDAALAALERRLRAEARPYD